MYSTLLVRDVTIQSTHDSIHDFDFSQFFWQNEIEDKLYSKSKDVFY